jgi:ParB-like chromosome segregation protein Spo0J
MTEHTPTPSERPDRVDLSTLTFHPLAEMLPLIGDDELKELADDIKKHGMLEPIMMFDGKVLDGRNRILALRALGDTHLHRSLFRELKCDRDPRAYVISENIRRRHLSPEQRRDVIAALLKANPEKSDRAIAAVAKVDNKTVAAVRGGLVSGEEIPHPKQRVGKDGKKQSGTKKGKGKGGPAPHLAYRHKQEELIDLLKETHGSYSQAVEWADNTKQRLDQTLAGIAEELDQQNATAA